LGVGLKTPRRKKCFLLRNVSKPIGPGFIELSNGKSTRDFVLEILGVSVG
jgi:hypothetical protein